MRADLRPEKADFRPERADFKPTKADSKLERVDFRPERADFRPNRSPKGNNMWSAIPVALLCMVVNRNERKQGSGPEGDEVL